MNEQPIGQRDLFDSLPAEWPDDLLPTIRERARASGRKVIVLDDDPTGTQTVHGIPVLTEWPASVLVEALKGESPAIYLLTNSRSLPPVQAQLLNAEIGQRLAEARERSGRDFVIVSRSDSTLRGHFPGEVDALAGSLAQAAGMRFDGTLVIPFFPEGGRYTVGDIHYVAEGDLLVPAGQTEFARDKSFGYNASNLREWVVEKTKGDVRVDEVHAISLDSLRKGGPDAVTKLLLDLPDGAVCIVNAASYRDLEVLVAALLFAEAAGKRYLYRTAASFVRVRAGIPPRELLSMGDLSLPSEGAALVIAGSYVPKTSAQLETLLRVTGIAAVEVQVPRLMDESTRQEEIERAIRAVNDHLASGEDTVVFTSRNLVSGEGAEANLAIGRTVSDSLVSIVRSLAQMPRYLLAKGGITSSDVATSGLGIKQATVLGQILPGVPVWRAGSESLFPGMTYIVFPGNVGGPDALAKIVRQLAVQRR